MHKSVSYSLEDECMNALKNKIWNSKNQHLHQHIHLCLYNIYFILYLHVYKCKTCMSRIITRSCVFFCRFSFIYCTGQKFGHTFSFNAFPFHFHDYLHCSISLKASKLWMNTYGIMYLTKKCEITENMFYILDSSK